MNTGRPFLALKVAVHDWIKKLKEVAEEGWENFESFSDEQAALDDNLPDNQRPIVVPGSWPTPPKKRAAPLQRR